MATSIHAAATKSIPPLTLVEGIEAETTQLRMRPLKLLAPSDSRPLTWSARPSAAPTSIIPFDPTATLVHDLKAPLSALTMNLEYALAELPEGAKCDDVREALHDCRAAGARLFRMVTNLLDLSRAE